MDALEDGIVGEPGGERAHEERAIGLARSLQASEPAARAVIVFVQAGHLAIVGQQRQPCFERLAGPDLLPVELQPQRPARGEPARGRREEREAHVAAGDAGVGERLSQSPHVGARAETAQRTTRERERCGIVGVRARSEQQLVQPLELGRRRDARAQ